MARNCQGVLFYPPKEGRHLNFQLQDLVLRNIEDDECLVEIVATGVCHTDLGVASRANSTFPRVLGHEGAGYLRKIGDKVDRSCRSGHPSYCYAAYELNFGSSKPPAYTLAVGTGQTAGAPVVGGFFGQSSFSNFAIVSPNCIISVADSTKTREELQLFAPLGCGFQTGAATVSKLANAQKNDSVAIIGLGGAAKVIGCERIIAIDRVPERLRLAEELGATSVIDTSTLSKPLDSAVRDIADGIGSSVTVDTTGVLSIIEQALDMTSILGRMVLLGMSQESINIDMTKFKLSGKTLLGSVQGDAVPAVYVSQLIQWYRAGDFPIEKLVRYYKPQEICQAIEDMKGGKTVKPVILW